MIEFERQKEILTRFLPRPPARVLDIGGGPGAYSLWLAHQGYEVHLLDVMGLHIEEAKRRAQAQRVAIDATVGDARALPYPDRFADALLLMGPLYHLTDPAGRKAALLEARRVLRPGGLLATVGISRFTSMLDGSWQGFIRDPKFRPIVSRDLRSGQHRNPPGHPSYFTTAYFHHPEELRSEIKGAGFRDVHVVASEGFLWWTPGILELWKDTHLREYLKGLLRRVEEEPSLIGLGPHLMGLARRPRRRALPSAP
ncbi:MAG: class I SAM-dependent methyltransferase [Euryarchaeota archaeon]|nr:class I SAM-dependent methyltransferase [Euryarchaeota archaeon]MDE1836790.1 class I SAM-dependent methyltransferase [Euryarchaeota archaeon]MDE1879808.1 class I SAM-dependent methyltransferase [Euryarchaeota archaeon]MDE2044774.1 class I SAM-dependent methyltransferase [Thermoplasmata archaeon]